MSAAILFSMSSDIYASTNGDSKVNNKDIFSNIANLGNNTLTWVQDTAFDVAAFIVAWIIVMILMATPIGQIGFIAIVGINIYWGNYFEAIAFASAVLIPYWLLFILIGSGRKKVAGKKSKPAKTKKSTGGPIGGSHVAEGMIFDKHYDNMPAVWAARKLRDKIFR